MKEAIHIVGQELRWCVDNKGASGKGDAYEKAFIDGIVHIHNLLLSAKAPTEPAGELYLGEDMSQK